jgi:SH3-like domain-containing protein
MRSPVVYCATRILLTFAIVMAAGVAGAVTPDDPNIPPVKHHRKPDPHRPGDARQPPAAKSKTAHAPPAEPKVVPPVAVAPPAAPKPPKEAPVKESTDPPPKIPRFAALKTDDTNMRRGPGQRYPIDWVYQRRDLPVEVEREYDVWRYVRDPEGVQGWVHQVTLSDRRTFMVTGKDATLRADAKDAASAVAELKVGVIGRLKECDEGSKWCQVQVGGYRGYLRRDQIWGLLPDEVVAPS